MSEAADRLARRLSLFDAVVIGLGAMIGAAIFAAPGPAAAAAGWWLLAGLVLASVCPTEAELSRHVRAPREGPRPTAWSAPLKPERSQT